MRTHLRRGERGFTLLEIVAVLVLVGILAAMAMASTDTNDDTVATAQAIESQLRFAQLKAMSDVSKWGIQVSANSCVLLQSGATATSMFLPGENGATYTLPSAVSVTAGTATIEFDYRGRPYINGTYLDAGTHTITVSGNPDIDITISSVTGFIP